MSAVDGPGEALGDGPGDGSRDGSGETAYVALGSNLGDRRKSLEEAAAQLARSPGILRLRLSSIRETEPVGEAPPEAAALPRPLGGPYLNAVAEVRTVLEPRGLLVLCRGIEDLLGRRRAFRNAPRTIDLDILLHGERIVRDPDLVVPHPRLLEREFVLEPLAEIAPDRRHPVSGRTLGEHWEELRSRHAHHRPT